VQLAAKRPPTGLDGKGFVSPIAIERNLTLTLMCPQI
jgi:hypothetical protein